MRKPVRVYTDPRADRVALGFTTLILEEIADQRVRLGRDHYEARDRACRLFADQMVAQGGKAAADAAIRAVHTLAPAECLTKAERVTVNDRDRRERIALYETVRRRPMGWFNRISMRLFGMPFL